MALEEASGHSSASEQQHHPPPSPMISGGGHPMDGPGAGPLSSSDLHGDPRYGGPWRGGPPVPQPPPHGSYGGPYSSYPPPPYGNYGGPPAPPGYHHHRGPPPPHGSPSYPPPPPSPYGNSSYGGYASGPMRHPSYPPYGGYDYPAPPPPRGPHPSMYGPASPMPSSGRDPPTSSPPDGPPSSRPNGSPSSPPNYDNKKGSPPNGRCTPSGSPETTVSSGTLQPHLVDGKLVNHVEVERLRAAAATEITTEEVKPIQTDFHFFVKDNIAKYRPLAEAEVRKSLGLDPSDKEPLDPLLVNSNLNTRLMKAWEALTRDQRDAYMIKEEDDRRRFMEEDEIASRHCATLTARGKNPKNTSPFAPSPTLFSPRTGSGVATTLQGSSAESRMAETDTNRPRSRANHMPEDDDDDDEDEDDDDDDELSEEKKSDDGDETYKRSAPATGTPVKGEDTHESPTKKNKIGAEKGDV
ncbi:hypothetical protein IV203_016492 [Nitzschia inconspicua]|uniref:Uncharacterized protein n=1 Tax=Nitzschia inconspicua TaxID=303405 RepID=A0A9K3PHF5_9STRA|nr:hypothetical protein IV203_016492 [Nitzschia inconspicua]